MFHSRVSVNWISRRLAGHSKWANIKHIKATKDAQKSTMFTKFSRQIKVAIQEGGSANPDANLRLSNVVEQAKRNSMPIASIQSVIKSTQQKKNNCKSGLLEIRGPGGSIILCEIFTDNVIRTKQAVAAVIKKHSAVFSDGGGKHLFHKKGVIEARRPENQAKTDEEKLEILMEHAIESGAEDIKLVSDDIVSFICDQNSLKSVQSVLEQFKYEITSASLEYLASRRVQLNDDSLENLSVMYDKLEGQEDVVRLYDNIG